jgi:chromosome segregation protein
MLENKQAEFLRLSEDTNATIKELELRMRENEELTEKYETLKAKHSELFVNQEQTSYENLFLKKDLETLRAICNETESSIDSERNDFKRCLKETNSKIEELSRERDNLGHQLKLNHKEIDALKENYRLVMVKFEKQKSQIDAESLEKGLIENKIREMRQVLEDKTKDFQNLEKYLNDVQRDREEEIKQYEADMENMRTELEAVKKMLHEEQTERQDKTEKLNSEKASLTLELEKINSLAGDLEGLLTTERSKSIEDAKRFEEMIDGLIKKDSINTETILRLEANLAEEMRQYKVKFDSFNAR